jgi:hypothetical protein
MTRFTESVIEDFAIKLMSGAMRGETGYAGQVV